MPNANSTLPKNLYASYGTSGIVRFDLGTCHKGFFVAPIENLETNGTQIWSALVLAPGIDFRYQSEQIIQFGSYPTHKEALSAGQLYVDADVLYQGVLQTLSGSISESYCAGLARLLESTEREMHDLLHQG